MSQLMCAAGSNAALDNPTVVLPDVHSSGDKEQTLTNRSTEFAPEMVRAPKQRYIAGILSVRHPDDPIDAV